MLKREKVQILCLELPSTPYFRENEKELQKRLVFYISKPL